MFSPPIIRLLLAGLAASLVLRQPVTTLLLALVLLTIALAHSWRRLALRRVEVSVSLSRERAFPGDPVELALRLVNRKPLPLTFVELIEQLPKGLRVENTRLASHGEQRFPAIRQVTALGWYEAQTWRYTLRAGRGVHRFGPAHLRSGDPFGMLRDERQLPESARLIVYPRLLAERELGFPLRRLIGDLRKRQHLLSDPVRTIGIRDYHRDDPLKQVHWSATARRGQLQTRVFEPTSALDLLCIVDVDTFAHVAEGIWREQFEWMLSLAATVARQLAGAGHSVGFWTNGASAERKLLVRLPPSGHPQQLTRILETLAALTPYSIAPLGKLLKQAPPQLAPGTTLLLIAATWSADTQAALERLRQRGHPALVVFAGATAPTLAGGTVYHAPFRPGMGPGALPEDDE
ncbi:MAG TPA: DUF58 domain-containing protein [Herpetosiphonaceae bacterium]